MIKSILLFCPFLISVIAASAQRIEPVVTYNNTVSDNNLVAYTPGRKLTIDDFKANPEEKADVVAVTSSGFSMKAGFRNKEGKITLLVTVSCTFDQQHSWMKEEGKNSYILEHEQHHFDISYLSALHFMEKIKKATLTADNYKEQLQSLNQAAIDYMRELQRQYDSETANGKQKDNQFAWNKKISEQIFRSVN